MKLGRLILTHREDLIGRLRDFYLSEERTTFLVIACDATKVDAKKFSESGSFRVVPFSFPEVAGATMNGRQWRVWIEIAKKFPEIEGWVIHDYDFIAKPSDAEIFGHIAPNEYGMIGRAFPVWQPGMAHTNIDTYPFPQSHRYWHQNLNPEEIVMHQLLMKLYPVSFQGIQTVVGGFVDFIAASKTNILLLDDPKMSDPNLEGVEQIPHTIWRARGVRPADMRKFYKMKVLLDVKYIPFSDEYDMMNPVKYWPGQKPDSGAGVENLKYRFKKFIKQLIGRKGYRFGR